MDNTVKGVDFDPVREKMIDLVTSVLRCLQRGEVYLYNAEDIAEQLISHGVTVWGWVSVSEKLPTKEDANGKGHVLAFCKKEGFVNKWRWNTVVKYRRLFSHWMPMPQAPKGE